MQLALCLCYEVNWRLVAVDAPISARCAHKQPICDMHVTREAVCSSSEPLGWLPARVCWQAPLFVLRQLDMLGLVQTPCPLQPSSSSARAAGKVTGEPADAPFVQLQAGGRRSSAHICGNRPQQGDRSVCSVRGRTSGTTATIAHCTELSRTLHRNPRHSDALRPQAASTDTFGAPARNATALSVCRRRGSHASLLSS